MNFEETDIQVLSVTVIDGLTTPITQTIEITVVNQYEQPINNLITVAEDVPKGTFVSSIVLVDADLTETFHCTLPDSSNEVFHIDCHS